MLLQGVWNHTQSAQSVAQANLSILFESEPRCDSLQIVDITALLVVHVVAICSCIHGGSARHVWAPSEVAARLYKPPRSHTCFMLWVNAADPD